MLEVLPNLILTQVLCKSLAALTVVHWLLFEFINQLGFSEGRLTYANIEDSQSRQKADCFIPRILDIPVGNMMNDLE